MNETPEKAAPLELQDKKYYRSNQGEIVKVKLDRYWDLQGVIKRYVGSNGMEFYPDGKPLWNTVDKFCLIEGFQDHEQLQRKSSIFSIILRFFP